MVMISASDITELIHKETLEFPVKSVKSKSSFHKNHTKVLVHVDCNGLIKKMKSYFMNKVICIKCGQESKENLDYAHSLNTKFVWVNNEEINKILVAEQL